MGHNGSEYFKTLLLLQIAAKRVVLKFVLNFPPNGPHKTKFEIFEILSFDFFFENFKLPL